MTLMQDIDTTLSVIPYPDTISSTGHIVITFFSALAILIASIVIFAIAKQRLSNLNISEIFVLNLCVADLVFSLFCFTSGIWTNVHGGWAFGASFCGYYAMILIYLEGVSVLSLLCVTIERHFVLLRGRYLTRTEALWSIAFVWIILIPFIFMPIYLNSIGYQTALQPGNFFCAVAWFYNSPIVYLSNFLIFGVVILCGIFMVYTYSAIFLKYHRLLVLKDIRRAQDFDEISGIADLTASVIERDHELTPQELLLLKKCVVITGSFILLWVPYFSKVLVEMILHEQSSSLLEVICASFIVLATSVNGILLCLYDPLIKSNVKDVFGPTISLLSNQISFFSKSKENVAKHTSPSKPEYSSKEKISDGSNAESLVSIDTRANDDDRDGEVVTIQSRESQFETTPPVVSLGWEFSAVAPNAELFPVANQGGGGDLELESVQGAQSPLL